jgi:hypothetical protein
MRDDAAPVFTIIALLLALALFLLPFIAFFVYVFYQNSRRKSLRARLMREMGQLASQYPSYPVRYASEERFKAFFKIFPWEGAGVILVAPGLLHFLGETFAGRRVELQLMPANSRLNWLGKCPWPNGAVSWFEAVTAGGKHYFTSETGPFIFGSHAGTRAIYDGIVGGAITQG